MLTGRPAGVIVERADVEVGELVGREQGEAAAADRAAGEIVGKIVVRGDPRAGADPDTLDRLARRRDRRDWPREARRNNPSRRSTRDRSRARRACPHWRRCPAKISGSGRAPGAEIHAHRFVVEQPLAAARLADIHGERAVAAMVEQIGAGRAPLSSPAFTSGQSAIRPRTTNGASAFAQARVDVFRRDASPRRRAAAARRRIGAASAMAEPPVLSLDQRRRGWTVRPAP